MHSASVGTGPIALSTLLDDALRRLEPLRPTDTAPSDGFLYSGNRHESVPRALFFDRRLTPLERNAWQVFRLQLNEDGLTASPTYEQLRPFLTSMPCVPKASHATVARALTVLRLTRWLSLVRRRRDARMGRVRYFICNAPSASAVVSVLHRPVESAANSGPQNSEPLAPGYGSRIHANHQVKSGQSVAACGDLALAVTLVSK